MDRFVWWHRIRRHRVVKFLAPDRPVTFLECRDCPDDKGWASASSRCDLRNLPIAVTYTSPVRGGELRYPRND